jgi:hypothetical protein
MQSFCADPSHSGRDRGRVDLVSPRTTDLPGHASTLVRPIHSQRASGLQPIIAPVSRGVQGLTPPKQKESLFPSKQCIIDGLGRDLKGEPLRRRPETPMGGSCGCRG